LGALALILAIANAMLFSSNRQTQNEVNTRGQYIQQTLQVEPLYQSLIKSLAELAAKNNDAQLRDLLATQGITFGAPVQPAPIK
jgi:ferritin